MATIVTRAGKGSPLTHNEVDANFNNLNNDKVEESTTITAGTGLTGGGDLSANRTISLANTAVAAGSYGSASAVGTFTVDAQGRLTAASNTNIAIANTAVSGLGTMSTQNANSVAITGGSINGTTVGASTASTGAFTTLSASSGATISGGNLTFSSTAQRITGDMSNATLANRLMFQTSTTNGATQLRVIPNGTGTTGSIQAGNNNDPANQSVAALNVDSSEVRLASQINGTGSYLPMTFYTGGSERVRIDTSGNVGIGTASPISPLTVESTSNVRAVIRNSTENTSYSCSLDFLTGTGSFASTNVVGRVMGIITQADPSALQSALAFVTNSGDSASEKMRITSAGNVGIGTASPGTKLDVSGSIRASASVTVGNGGGTYQAGSIYSDANWGMIFRAAQASPAQAQFRWANSADSEFMRIDSSGNVGIGTASTGFNSAGLPLVVGSGSGNTGMTIYSGTASSGSIHFGDTVTTGADGYRGFLNYTHNTNSMQFGTDATERMRIDSVGNVGIGGTVATAFVKCQINGTLPTSGTLSIGFSQDAAIPSGTTTLYAGFNSAAGTQAASFTLASYAHYRASQGTFGAGSAVTNQYGFFIESNLTGATNNFGIYSNIASGSNRWNFYAAGTARNYFAGQTDVGNTEILASNAWNGVQIRSKTGISLASGASINLSTTIAGGAIVAVYVAGSGNGGLFWVNYSGTVTKLAGNGEATDTGSDFAVYKSAASHTSTLKNKAGVSQDFYVAVLSGQLV